MTNYKPVEIESKIKEIKKIMERINFDYNHPGTSQAIYDNLDDILALYKMKCHELELLSNQNKTCKKYTFVIYDITEEETISLINSNTKFFTDSFVYPHSIIVEVNDIKEMEQILKTIGREE